MQYRCGDELGDGTLWNISLTGARLEAASLHVEPGAKLWLRLSLFPGSFEVELLARVVRRTPRGFALSFESLGPEQRAMLQRALPGLP